MKTLKDAKVGETVTVAKLNGEGPVKRRIMDMGITKGVQIYVRKVAPLGDPMELLGLGGAPFFVPIRYVSNFFSIHFATLLAG